MRAHFALPHRAVRRFLLWLLMAVLTWVLLLLASQSAAAQCLANPTGETAVGLRNASSHYLVFYIDGVRKEGVPAGDRSDAFVVTPGEHTLRADATVGDETISASHTGNIPAGYVCSWTVTDPPPKADRVRSVFRNSLRRESR